MTSWDSANRRARDELLEGLAKAGFDVKTSSRAVGFIESGDREVPVDLELLESFPYSPPKVRPIDGTGGLSWHADPDGYMCLWAEEESGDLPWQTADQVIDRCKEWFKNASEGWPDDAPDLDLERYWPQKAGLVIYDDLDRLVGQIVRLERQRNNTHVVKPGPPPKRGKQLAAAILDLGELDQPLRSFDDVLVRAGELRGKLEREVDRGRLQVIVLRYRRGDQSSVLALTVTSRTPVELAAVASAHAGKSTMRLRAGLDQSALENKSVAIVGLGAIGSHVAELLARAGIGHLSFFDHDVIRPGNCVRHLAGRDEVGQLKVEAVRGILAERNLMPSSAIECVASAVMNPDSAQKILEDHDLVVDASANATATRLLVDGATFLQKPCVSVCLLHEGRTLRIDRFPLAPKEDHQVVPDPIPVGVVLREGGCGDPVSPAPMWAVTAASSRGVAIAVDLLSGRNQYPASIVDVLIADGSTFTTPGMVA